MNLTSQKFNDVLTEISARVDAALELWLPQSAPEICARLNEAVRYSALAGGKRIRPALCLMVAEGLGLLSPAPLRAGCAFELIHTYSLIHDDLPAMDNDDFRRGKPTSHKVFGEATAVLAGDSLLTLAFEWFASLIEMGVAPDRVVKIIKIAAQASGWQGMIGGQMLDLQAEQQQIGLSALETIHQQKTGALIIAPIEVGAILAGASAPDLECLTRFGRKTGLLFQIVDDVLDVEGDASKLGKSTGRDCELGKSTYPALMGLSAAKDYAKSVRDDALTEIDKLSCRIDILKSMVDFIYYRQH